MKEDFLSDPEKMEAMFDNMDRLQELQRRQADLMEQLKSALIHKMQRKLDGLQEDERLIYPNLGGALRAGQMMAIRKKVKESKPTEIMLLNGRRLYIGFLEVALRKHE